MDTLELNQFTGTEAYYRLSPLFPNYVLTDGTNYVAKNGGTNGAFWLFETIASYWHRIKNDPDHVVFMVWKLKVAEDKSAVLLGEDGNDNVIFEQKIEWTDFQPGEFVVYCEAGEADGKPVEVLLLPSEH